MITDDCTVLRYIWPPLTRCPECTAEKHREAGQSGRIRYRICTACGHSYKVIAIAAHVDRGGDQSEIRYLI